MSKIELKNDVKLTAIFSEKDISALTRQIAKGYLKGRGITQFYDLLPNVNSKISFELSNGKIYQVSDASNKKQKNVCKLSHTPFWLRKVIHKIAMLTNAFGYKKTHMAKALTIATAFQNAVETPFSELGEYQNGAFVFSKKAFQPKTKPKSFEGKVITEDQLRKLLSKHQDILDEAGAGTHGEPEKNIIMAFTEGTFDATVKGRQPLIANPLLNKDLIRKTRELMSLISTKDLTEQSRLLKQLIDPFKACAVGRIFIIQQLYDELLSVNLGFEGEVENKLHAFKHSLLEQLILEQYPNQDPYTAIHLQLPHLTTGYLAVVGKSLGIEGYAAAAADNHKHVVLYSEQIAFIKKFQKRFQLSLDEFCMGIVSEINTKNDNGGINVVNYGRWAASRFLNKELPESFGYYAEEKKAFYDKLNPADDDQEGCLTHYISPAEVKQLLNILNLIEETQ